MKTVAHGFELAPQANLMSGEITPKYINTEKYSQKFPQHFKTKRYSFMP